MTPDPFAPIATARLLLRCVAVGDAASLSSLITPQVSRWVANWPAPFTLEMAASRIEQALRAAETGNALPLAILADGDMVGWISINRNETHPRHGSFGYWLGERHHSKGYMKEAAPAALAAGFRVLDLDIIEAAAQPENKGSISVLRACGMQPVGQRVTYAPARQREELCEFFELVRSGALAEGLG